MDSTIQFGCASCTARLSHRWIRTHTAGFEDPGNVSKKLREGWEFVKAETILSEIGENDYPVIHEGKHAGLIGIGGLVLARIPEEILKQRLSILEE